jgi:hypothetical protein
MKTVLPLVAGLLLGASLFHAPAIKAKSTTSTHIFITPVGITDLKSIPADVDGSPVVGISCVHKPLPKAPDAAVCYVAATNDAN